MIFLAASCPVPVDFAFILDGSGSISPKNWVIVKDNVKRIIDSFEVSQQGTHFALLEYSTEPKVYLRFNDFPGAELNGVNVKRKVEQILQSKGKTFIDKALMLANQEIFTEASGMRPGVKKVSCITKGCITQSGLRRYKENNRKEEKLNVTLLRSLAVSKSSGSLL